MTSRALQYFRDNQKLIVLTFQVFWILVFLLDRVGGGGNSEVPQFIYANF